MYDSSQFVRIVEEHQGLKIGCLEEGTYEMGFIDAEALFDRACRFRHTDYRVYLMHILLEDCYALVIGIGPLKS